MINFTCCFIRLLKTTKLLVNEVLLKMVTLLSSNTPKTSNLSRLATQRSYGNRGDALAGTYTDRESHALSFETTPVDHDSKSFQNVMAQMDKLQQHLIERNESDTKFTDLVFCLTGSNESENIMKMESEGVVTMAAGQAEELYRRLKVANERISAKEDAFDLIFCQWQDTQKRLETAEKEKEKLTTQLEYIKNRLAEKDSVIDNLQFKLFLAESELEASEEDKDNSPLLARRAPRNGHNLVEPSVTAVATSGASVKNSETEKENNPFAPTTPSSNESASTFLTTSTTQMMEEDHSRKKPSFLRKKGIFAGRYSSLDNDNREGPTKQFAKRRVLFARALAMKRSSSPRENRESD